MSSEPTDGRSLDEAEELLVEVLSTLERGGSLQEALGGMPPELGETVRRRLRLLGNINLITPGNPRVHDSVGGWHLNELLGRGGMGEVWRATSLETGQEIALKLLRTGPLDPTHGVRFEREAQALSRIRHPGIVQLVEAGEADGRLFIAMELLDGVNLTALLQKGPRPSVAQVVNWGHELALALDAAHSVGVVHRDVKPSNVQITREGRAVLVDFGLTRGIDPSSLSVTGRFVGSPHYAAPEQILGRARDVGPRTDVYSLGVTMYEALAGAPPFEGSSSEQLFHRILTTTPAPLRTRRAGLPEDLETVVFCALEKNPSRRYTSAAAFAADLRAIAELRPIQARRPNLARRISRWARRHRARATAVLSLAIALTLSLSWELWGHVHEQRTRVALARAELDDAGRLLNDLLGREAGLPGRVARYQRLKVSLESQPFRPGVTRRLDELQREIEEIANQRELVFAIYLDKVRRAEDLDPDLAIEVARGRARLYLERWRFASENGDHSAALFYAGRVRETDPTGELADALQPIRRFRLTTRPRDARVDVFLYRRLCEMGETPDPRLVPVPLGGIPQGAPVGKHALSVVGAVPPLVPTDLVLQVAGAPIAGTVFARLGDGELVRIQAINGRAVWDVGSAEDALSVEAPPWTLSLVRDGERHELLERRTDVTLLSPLDLALEGGHEAEIWREGERILLRLPPGLRLRETATPLLCSPESRPEHGSTGELVLPGGDCLLLISAPGHEPLRVTVDRGLDEFEARLVPEGTFPHPFRRIAPHGTEIIVMDREVSQAEYASYLESNPDRALPPGWSRKANGTLRPPSDSPEAFPVHSITYRDALAYADWRNANAQAQGHPWTLRLPHVDDWLTVTHSGADPRPFVWGNEFRTQYAKGCFTRARPRLEPMLRFPVDETMLGIHDTAGSVSEFCRGWFWEERAQRPVCGGSWVNGDPRRFQSNSQWGAKETDAFEFVGFRLELVPDD